MLPAKREPSRGPYVAAALVIVLLTLAALPARADLPTPKLGPGIDPFPSYQGERGCDPDPEPGVIAFRRLVRKAFPNTGKGYISRACSAATSEHEEGRAWDWIVSASSRSDRRKVNRLFDWLLKRDRYAHRYARIRRLGIMYIIWNRRSWAPWSGWRSYSGSSPHTDHVHFSFTWDGARKRTTYWHRGRSFATATAAHPGLQGLWATTGNATVLSSGASNFHGDQRRKVGAAKVVGMAATPSGDGYWLVKRRGALLAFGNAVNRGTVPDGVKVADIAAKPYGGGYWILSPAGRVYAFGNAVNQGSVQADITAVGLTPTPTGNGYWVVSRRGRVFEFGDAKQLGELSGSSYKVVDIESAPTQGFWLVTRQGRVFAFGAAEDLGDTQGNVDVPIVGLASVPSGNGYWLVNVNARADGFGNVEDSTLTGAPTPLPEPPHQGVLSAESVETASFLQRILAGRTSS